MHQEPLWTKDFILLAISNTFLFLAFEMLLPTLPAYISAGGGGDSSIGLIMGIFTVTAILARPLSECGVKRWGKKAVLLMGLLICLVASVGYYASASVMVILMFRLLHGIGFGFATTLYGTIAAGIIPGKRRGEGLGFFAIGSTLAASLGPFIGLMLIDQDSFFPFFMVVIVILIVTIGFTFPIKASTNVLEHENVVNQKETKWYNKFVEKKAVFPSFFVMLLGLSYGGILSFITLFSKEVNISNIGYFFLVVPLFEFLVRFVAGKIYDKNGPFLVLVTGGLFCLLGVILLALSSSLTMLLVSGAFYGMGYGAIFPTIQAWIIDRVPVDKQTIATATFYNFFDLGIGIGALLLGFIAGYTTYSTMYLFSSLVFVVFLVVYIISVRSRNVSAGIPHSN
ncbi:MAG: transporter [Neobacillus sp.]|nr:transporter [Neobacillus sp.]